MTIYDFKVKDISGNVVSLSDYQDHVLIVVNVASQCAFTKQYEGLEKLYEKYKDRKVAVLGFPCNQFGAQEPGNEEDIKKFCETKYHVKFPLFSKVEVNGENAHPLFNYLKKSAKGIFSTEKIKWNFTKFLIDRRGNVKARFAPQTSPEKLDSQIEKLL